MKKSTKFATFATALMIVMLPAISVGLLAGFIWSGLRIGFTVYEDLIIKVFDNTEES